MNDTLRNIETTAITQDNTRNTQDSSPTMRGSVFGVCYLDRLFAEADKMQEKIRKENK